MCQPITGRDILRYPLYAICSTLFLGQTRRYPKDKIENSKKILQFLYSLPGNDLSLLCVLGVLCG